MSFKFNARHILLTYARCPLSKERVLEALQSITEIKYYTICVESHQDGFLHIHAVLSFPKKFHTTSVRKFDLGVYHPNVKGFDKATDLKKTIAYVKKDGDFISTHPEDKDPPSIALAKALIEEGDLTARFIRENPAIIFKNFNSIRQFLSVLRPTQAPPMITDKLRHAWIHGPSNSGKTTILRAEMSLFYNPQEIPLNNDFSGITQQTDFLYLDEFRGDLTVQQLNRLCDGYTKLNTKGGSTSIAGLRVVIVSNFSPRDCYKNISTEILDTLLNRFRVYDLSCDVYRFYNCKLK